MLVAFVVTAVIDATSRMLARRRLPSFFRQVVGGFLATAATAGFFAIGVLPAGTEPALVVAAGITVLLSGSPWSAPRRTRSAGLLTGVVLGLKVAQHAGVAAVVVGAGSGLLRRIGRVPWGKVPPLVVVALDDQFQGVPVRRGAR